MRESVIQDELKSTFDRGEIKKREGKYEYLEVQTVVQRLNDILGYDGWDFTIMEREQTEQELIVFGSMVVRGEEGSVTRMQCGRKRIAFKRGSDIPMDLGNDWKSAIGDCIKKCATLFGVGLYIKDDAPYGGADNNSGRRQPQQQQSRQEPNEPSQPACEVDEVKEMQASLSQVEKKF